MCPEVDAHHHACTDLLLVNTQAISHPKDEAEQAKAWEAVCPLVTKLKSFYDYSSEVEKMLPKILQELCQSDPAGTLERKQVWHAAISHMAIAPRIQHDRNPRPSSNPIRESLCECG